MRQAQPADWRQGRRRAARSAILEAAWAVVAEGGLAGLSIRDLAHRAGISTPTVYAYFASKNEIYDAMFGQTAQEFHEHMRAPYQTEDPREALTIGLRRFIEFCVADVQRYHLLFQRTIPGFEPSPESYGHAVAALETSRQRLAAIGITQARHLDLWTALVTGLVDQQISNDPGGDRWIRLIDESIEMFLAHCQGPDPGDSPRGGRGRRSPKGGPR